MTLRELNYPTTPFKSAAPTSSAPAHRLRRSGSLSRPVYPSPRLPLFPSPTLPLCWLAFLLPLALPAQPVETVKVIAKFVDRKVQLPAEFVPYESVAIHAKVTGFVDRINVDRGSVVHKGQLLATLVAPEMTAQRAEAEAKAKAVEAQRAEAQAKLAGLQATYERLKAASQTPGVIAGNELIQAEKLVEAAQAQVHAVEASENAARAAVSAIKDTEEYLKVTAPFTGVVTQRNVHPGALVGASGPVLFQLEQNTRLRLVVSVPEADVSGIARGSHVPFTVPAYPGAIFTGTIARIPHSMDPKTRSMAVELDVPNAQLRLAPGMYAAVAWPVRRSKPSLLVPPTSIVSTTERTFVIRIRDGVVEWVNVARGAPAGNLVEVFGPLNEGDTVAKRGTDELREGAKVSIK